MINVQHISGGYNDATVVHDISFHVQEGEFFGIIGPNGSGKTTLIKMISGILPVQTGTIELNNKPITAYPPKKLAQYMSVLPQISMQTFSFTVKETVSLGRYAHQSGLFHTFSARDEQIVEEVMDQTGVRQYENITLDKLSGGERQRVFLAQALAQEPQVIILDEPTNHLDLTYQIELLDLLKGWTKENDLIVISIFHELNLASLYCDRLLLLDEGHMKICDVPDAVLKKDRIEGVYKTTIEQHPHPRVPKPQIMLMPKKSEYGARNQISADHLHLSKEKIVLKSTVPLKTISSGVTGAGVGWYKTFVNRNVAKNYNVDNYREEMINYLLKHQIDPEETVGMMTSVSLEDVAYEFIEGDGFSLLIVITAGVGNAVDASLGSKHTAKLALGTINTWIIVNGELTDEAFLQSVVTATEAKTKALHKAKVKDHITGTLATGTSTDSILVAATQMGNSFKFAGPITPLGSMIAKGVYTCTMNALKKYDQRISQ